MESSTNQHHLGRERVPPPRYASARARSPAHSEPLAGRYQHPDLSTCGLPTGRCSCCVRHPAPGGAGPEHAVVGHARAGKTTLTRPRPSLPGPQRGRSSRAAWTSADSVDCSGTLWRGSCRMPMFTGKYPRRSIHFGMAAGGEQSARAAAVRQFRRKSSQGDYQRDSRTGASPSAEQHLRRTKQLIGFTGLHAAIETSDSGRGHLGHRRGNERKIQRAGDCWKALR